MGHEYRREKRSFLIASYFGNGIYSNENKESFSIPFTEDELENEYIYHKAKKIVSYFGKKVKYSDSDVIVPLFSRSRIYVKWFTRNGVKEITKKIQFFEHPIGLSYWLFDKGVFEKDLIKLDIENISKRNIILLINHFKKTFLINSHINENYLIFEDKDSILNVINEFLPKNIEYIKKKMNMY